MTTYQKASNCDIITYLSIVCIAITDSFRRENMKDPTSTAQTNTKPEEAAARHHIYRVERG